MNKVMAITDRAWLASIQEVRHISADSLREIGVPARYLDLDERMDRDEPFSNYLLIGDKAKHALTDYALAALSVRKPNVRVKAITFPALLDLLSIHGRDTNRNEYMRLTNTDSLFIYDFGQFPIKDWEMKNVGMYLMDRYNNAMPTSMAVEGLHPTQIAKHVGSVLWQVVKDNSLCRSV